MKLKKIKLPFKIRRPVLALGAQTKNTLCFVKGNFAYLSPVHADLDQLGDFLRFQETARYLLKKNPRIIAHDFHPEYQSSKYAYQLSAAGYTLSSVQHHHAHIVSCMVENNMKNQKVIGVAFDGAGLGLENEIWGAEFFICDYRGFTRAAHLREVPLIGGDRAVSEPWRLVAIWLYYIYRERFFNLEINFIRKINRNKWRVLKNMYQKGMNSPLASSMGRLFDAAASLILAKPKVNFEAELAMALERIARRGRSEARGYRFGVLRDLDTHILDPIPMFKGIIRDIKAGETREKMAYRFHLGVAEMIKDTAVVLRKKYHLNKVALSGGVFQNSLLLALSLDLLYREGFRVFVHKDLSCNDSSLSLGQAVIANFME